MACFSALPRGKPCDLVTVLRNARPPAVSSNSAVQRQRAAS